MKIEGKIYNKFIDYPHHATNMILIKNANFEYFVAFSDVTDDTLWEFISVGDSLFKDTNTFVFKIKRDSVTYEINYKCLSQFQDKHKN